MLVLSSSIYKQVYAHFGWIMDQWVPQSLSLTFQRVPLILVYVVTSHPFLWAAQFFGIDHSVMHILLCPCEVLANSTLLEEFYRLSSLQQSGPHKVHNGKHVVCHILHLP
jgi:hypothetical protein